jgi:formaldehyde-activating enzyme involved in methanogenesis
MFIGESFAGEGAEAAHVNTVLGHRDGPAPSPPPTRRPPRSHR